MSAPQHSPFAALYSPNSELELSLLRSRLDAEEIPYTVTNDHFGSLYIGVQVEAFNRRWILVEEAFLPQAQAVLEDFTARQNHTSVAMSQTSPGWWDKVRTLLEVVLLGWIVPRRTPVSPTAMTFDVRFDSEQHHFTATTAGALTAQGMLALGRTLLGHSRWQSGMSVIFDHRHLEFSMATLADLEAIRAFHRSHQNEIGNGRSAFVVGSGRVESWLELWQQGDKISSDHRTAVFAKMDEAQTWIRQPD
nr:DUF2007 domain-containing protein [uncultured Desulfuromonas sp.]